MYEYDYEDERDEEESGGRLFVILAIALIGLLVLGLLGIGGVFVIRQNLEQQTAASRPTPDIPVRLPQPSPTFTASPVPTNTPAPTPTNTPVVGADSASGGEEAASARVENVNEMTEATVQAAQAQSEVDAALKSKPAPTRPPVAKAETATAAEVPNTGLGVVESVLIAAGLIFVFVVARRMRLT